MLLALHEAVLTAGGAPLLLSELADDLDADPDVVRSMLAHAVAQGWLPDVQLRDVAAGCGETVCQPLPTRAVCRRCPMAGPSGR